MSLLDNFAMNFEDDYKLALRLQKKFNEENKEKGATKSCAQVIKQVKPLQSQKTISLADKSLEYSDPNPDIHALFLHFNDVFFWNKLMSVEVRWSPRMTSCAGICCYEGRGRLCSIRLSLPLLKLRPRKDLVETLLHEMIHAYLFVTNNNRDRDGHGPEFHKHMHRINQSAGTKITVYHTFHDEVRSYQQHWWQCQGPCRNRKPYFGMVRRAMNRAPGPSDFWWSDHQASCGGIFVKIREPEGYSAGKKRSKEVPLTKVKGKPVYPEKALSSAISAPEDNKPVASTSKVGILTYFSPKKAGGVSKSSEGTDPMKAVPASGGHSPCPAHAKHFVPFSGEGRVLGSKGGAPSCRAPPTKRPKLSDKLPPLKDPAASGILPLRSGESKSAVECPVCGALHLEERINEHLDECLACSKARGPSLPPTQGERWRIECPGCRMKVDEEAFDEHLDGCEAVCGAAPVQEVVTLHDDEVASLECVCPACGITTAACLLGEHLEHCLSTLSFNEDWT